ncbi:Tetratricopeptide repeat-containing protein [Duganella sp. CF517]|uniref:tetratricopeptide repeat protein n=1 Tax=Duganella sp. CF517 TaxID=1881038 RepID=UPI0008AFBEFD|nr:tetratricopeptide repeat protein [Duganella sp. CF517]SEN17679.1 Tetratricopeptide repeat-containing protein [Duganella sp. CF517]
MKAKSLASITLLAGAMALAAPVFAAAPTVHDVYVAAEAGKFTEAQALMDQVLKEHPNSAKAHFVEAELLAKQGKYAAAQKSLDTAERLSPGLPKVDATAVGKLRAVIAAGDAKPKENFTQHKPAAEKAGYNSGGYANGASTGSGGGGIPWGTVLLMGGLLVGFIFIASRFMSRRAQQGGAGAAGFNHGNPGFNPGGAPPGYPPGGGYPQQGYGPGYGQQPQGSGMGGRIMGGLATGAALGAGLVAGEAIARQFTGGHENGGNAANDQGRNDIVYDDPAQSNDMGGNDFGVSGGWDDSAGGGDAGGGSDEWN